MNRAFIFSLGGLVLSLSLSTSAHHSFSGQYDANKPIVFDGIVTKVE